jgi:hypothetical protein
LEKFCIVRSGGQCRVRHVDRDHGLAQVSLIANFVALATLATSVHVDVAAAATLEGSTVAAQANLAAAIEAQVTATTHRPK